MQCYRSGGNLAANQSIIDIRIAVLARTSLSLQPSESVVIQAASNIYAAYIHAGKVTEGQEQEWMNRAIREAIFIARTTDASIRSDEEMA